MSLWAIASASSGGLSILFLGMLFSGQRIEYLKLLLSAVLYFSLTPAICGSACETEYASI